MDGRSCARERCDAMGAQRKGTLLRLEGVQEGFPVAGESEPQKKSIIGQGVEIIVWQTKEITVRVTD